MRINPQDRDERADEHKRINDMMEREDRERLCEWCNEPHEEEGVFCCDACMDKAKGRKSSASELDQAALNTVAADMRKTAMRYVQAKDNARFMRAAELLALAIEKDASRIGAQGLMTPKGE